MWSQNCYAFVNKGHIGLNWVPKLSNAGHRNKTKPVPHCSPSLLYSPLLCFPWPHLPIHTILLHTHKQSLIHTFDWLFSSLYWSWLLFKEYSIKGGPLEFCAHTLVHNTHLHMWTHTHARVRRKQRVLWDCLENQSVWLTVSGIVP